MIKIKEMIKELKRERSDLETKMAKINNAIINLQKVDDSPDVSSKAKNIKIAPIRDYTKKKKAIKKKKAEESDDDGETYSGDLTEEDYEKLKQSNKNKLKDKSANLDGVSQEIQDFVAKSKSTDVASIRDGIIEKFEINIPTTKIRAMIKKKKKFETSLKYLGQIHYNEDGHYACNPTINARPEKLTKDKDKVTCMNCKSLMKIYPDYKQKDKYDEEDIDMFNTGDED